MFKRDKSKKKKETKVYFSPEIDSRISGFALVFTFAVVGLILQFFPNHFGNQVVTEVVKWSFIVIGVLGLCVEIGNQKTSIIGLDSLVSGLFLTGGWLIFFVFVKHWIANTLSFVFLILGLYALAMGFQQIVYSIVLCKKDNPAEKVTKETAKGDILLFLTKLLGVILVVVQICKAVMDINWPQV